MSVWKHVMCLAKRQDRQRHKCAAQILSDRDDKCLTAKLPISSSQAPDLRSIIVMRLVIEVQGTTYSSGLSSPDARCVDLSCPSCLCRAGERRRRGHVWSWGPDQPVTPQPRPCHRYKQLTWTRSPTLCFSWRKASSIPLGVDFL